MEKEATRQNLQQKSQGKYPDFLFMIFPIRTNHEGTINLL